MRTWLFSHWDSLRGSFWFLPLLMVAGALALSFITVALDQVAARNNVELKLLWGYTRGPEGSRALLATVAGSMMTIASVCFSITIVALQQASSQFGPRILHNFMRDRGNQAVLGTFIAGFTYCLMILRTVNGNEEHLFVPHLSVSVGVFFAVAGVIVLIYFIHHAATSIQAESVLASVSEDLESAIKRLFPEYQGEPAEQPLTTCPDYSHDISVNSLESGYLLAIDIHRLVRLAVENDLLIEVIHRPGQFVIQGNPLLTVSAATTGNYDEAIADVQGAFYFGTHRTLFQDVEFAIDQLVEVALRALSPGINDPFTALTCVDRLGAALAQVADRQMPSPSLYDEEGCLRVIVNAVTARGLADAAFNQLRQTAKGNTAVTLRLLEMITSLAPRVRTNELRTVLLEQAEVIYEGSQESLSASVDRADAQERFQRLKEAFKRGEA